MMFARAIIGAMFFFFIVSPPTVFFLFPLHDALPIPADAAGPHGGACLDPEPAADARCRDRPRGSAGARRSPRSEEHTSELQSRGHLVCRLLLEKKKRSAKDSCK